jgi:hypothetical protein
MTSQACDEDQDKRNTSAVRDVERRFQEVWRHHRSSGAPLSPHRKLIEVVAPVGVIDEESFYIRLS